MTILHRPHDTPRLASAILVVALIAVSVPLAKAVIDPLAYRLASSPERRLRALERLLERGDGQSLLESAIRDETGELHERALELLLDHPAPRALAERLERAPELADYRAAAALLDARALPILATRIRVERHRARAAAFTAFAAIATRTGVSPRALPRFAWEERAILGELACGLEEDSPPWRAEVLRALAAELDVSPVEQARVRASLDTLEDDALRERAVLWLRGDPLELDRLPAEHRALVGLLAPPWALARRANAGLLADLLATEQFGGAGDWRWLESARRDLLASALVRAPSPERPGARAASLILTRPQAPPDPARPDEIPPLWHNLGPEHASALIRAAGRPDGRLARVLEPGTATSRERLLLDLAVAALSTRARVTK
ncbi:MAG TPA: hypothetical protein VFF73_03010 [Planctomycetota bacterium]|nr:hypothetical protein [Planctomycetota bacterium]